MRSLAPWGVLPLLALPLDSLALALGEIETNSYLNQPLNAEIPLTATAEELNGLRVSLAPVAEFTRQGLEYPAVLRSVAVEVGQSATGANVIRVTSTRPVNELWLDLVIQVDYRSGTRIQTYSLIIDPPTFMPAEVSAAPIAPPATRDPAPQVAGGAVVREPAPQAAPAPAPAPAPAQPAPQRPAAAPAGGDYTVASGDTLWAIAERYRPSGVTTNQAMISIFEANPGAFGGNINQLRRGAILRIPPAAQLGSVSAAAATAEVRRQTEAWRAGVESEPRLVLLPPGEDTTSSGAAVSASNNAAVSALENEVSELEDQLAARDAELAEARRLLEVQSAELADLQRNVTAGEPTDAPVFEDELTVEATETPAPAVETAVEPEPAPAAETPAPAPAAAAASEDSGESLVDTVIGFAKTPIVWFAAAAVLVLMLVIGFLRRRGGDDVVEEPTGRWEALEEDISQSAAHSATTRLPKPDLDADSDMVVVEGGATSEEPALDFGDLDRDDQADDAPARTGTLEMAALEQDDVDDDAPTAGELPAAPAAPAASLSDDTLSSQTVINLDQADPVAEADFHMAYGLYDHAADLLNQALATDPDNRQLKLKLLEVYFVWGNKDQFVEQARSFRDGMGVESDGDWDKIVIMGKQISPDDELFADVTSVSKAIDLDLDAGSDDQGLDFTLEDDDGDGIDLDFAGADDDLDATGTSAATSVSAEDDTMEFGAQTQAGLEAAFLLDDDDDDDDATMESPTVEIGAFDESPADDDEGDDPTIEQRAADEPEASDGMTIESPTIEMPAAEDGDTVEQPDLSATGNPADLTAELALDDLGLDVGDIENLPAADELSATGVTRALDEGDFDIDSTGTAVLDYDDEDDEDASYTTRTEVLEQSAGQFEVEEPVGDDDLDLNLDELSSALGGGDTVEQPGPGEFDAVDLDVGADILADDEPTGTEELGLDPDQMTEVGTKLDLARAYIDMGDPEGARSILDEVLTEGDSGQRREAQALIDALPAA